MLWQVKEISSKAGNFVTLASWLLADQLRMEIRSTVEKPAKNVPRELKL